MRYKLGDDIYFKCSLSKGETNRHILAYIYSDVGNQLGAPIPLPHLVNGIYKSASPMSFPVGNYIVLFKPFMNPSYSVPDSVYGSDTIDLEVYTDVAVDISNIESKLDSLVSDLTDPDFEVELQDDDDVIEIELADDEDDNLLVEIEE